LEANLAVLTADGRPPRRPPTVRFSTVGKVGWQPTGKWPSGRPPGRPGYFQRAEALWRLIVWSTGSTYARFVHVGRPTSISVDRQKTRKIVLGI